VAKVANSISLSPALSRDVPEDGDSPGRSWDGKCRCFLEKFLSASCCPPMGTYIHSFIHSFIEQIITSSLQRLWWKE
jgi:hypothetical protein